MKLIGSHGMTMILILLVLVVSVCFNAVSNVFPVDDDGTAFDPSHYKSQTLDMSQKTTCMVNIRILGKEPALYKFVKDLLKLKEKSNSHPVGLIETPDRVFEMNPQIPEACTVKITIGSDEDYRSHGVTMSSILSSRTRYLEDGRTVTIIQGTITNVGISDCHSNCSTEGLGVRINMSY